MVPCTLWNFRVIISTVSFETSFPFKHTMFWQNPRIPLSKYMYTNFNNHLQPCLMIFLVLLAFSAYLRSPCTGKLIHVLGFALLLYSDWAAFRKAKLSSRRNSRRVSCLRKVVWEYAIFIACVLNFRFNGFYG